jgi:hypothetical protein
MLENIGSAYETCSATLEAFTDDGVYGVYNLKLTYDSARNAYLSGGYELYRTGNVEDIVSQLSRRVFSYTADGAGITLTGEAESGTVAQGYAGAGGGTAAACSINIGGGKYVLCADTRFVYMDIDAEDYGGSGAAYADIGNARRIEEGV